jgi:hypothetical protein
MYSSMNSSSTNSSWRDWVFPFSLFQRPAAMEPLPSIPVVDDWVDDFPEDKTYTSEDETSQSSTNDSDISCQNEYSSMSTDPSHIDPEKAKLMQLTPISYNRKQRRRQKQLEKMSCARAFSSGSQKKLMVGGEMVKF